MEEIERAAEALLAGVPSWIWDGESLPVPLDDIADTHFGLLVREADDLSAAPGAPPLAVGQSLSGLLLPELGEVWVNAEEARSSPGRRRFTIAHELGHWCMHRDRHESVYCRSNDRRGRRGEGARCPGAAPAARGGGQRVRRRAADAGHPRAGPLRAGR